MVRLAGCQTALFRGYSQRPAGRQVLRQAYTGRWRRGRAGAPSCLVTGSALPRHAPSSPAWRPAASSTSAPTAVRQSPRWFPSDSSAGPRWRSRSPSCRHLHAGGPHRLLTDSPPRYDPAMPLNANGTTRGRLFSSPFRRDDFLTSDIRLPLSTGPHSVGAPCAPVGRHPTAQDWL